MNRDTEVRKNWRSRNRATDDTLRQEERRPSYPRPGNRSDSTGQRAEHSERAKMKRRILLLGNPKQSVAAHLQAYFDGLGCEVHVVTTSSITHAGMLQQLQATLAELMGAIVHIEAPVATAELALVRALRCMGLDLPVIALVPEHATRGTLIEELLHCGVTRYVPTAGDLADELLQLIAREVLSEEWNERLPDGQPG